jgi:hypothetical protein
MAQPSLPRFVAVPAPELPRFGLESVVLWQETGPKDLLGVGIEPWRCDAARLTSGLFCLDESESPYGQPKAFESGVGSVLASPFAVYGEYSCNPVGRSEAEAEERARQHLRTGASRAIERAIQFGEPGNEPTLVTEAVDINPGGAVSTVEGIALLEQHLGENYGGTGVLHMSRRLATHAIAEGLVISDGSQLRTSLGTLVAAGSGYDSSQGPDESPESPGESPSDSELWVYATGAVYGWRSDVQVIPGGAAMDIEYNTLTVLAEQIYVLAWECLTAAVLIAPAGI